MRIGRSYPDGAVFSIVATALQFQSHVTYVCISLSNVQGDAYPLREEKGQMEKLMRFFKDEKGVTAIEYSLIAALIAIVIVVMVTLAGESVSGLFSQVASALDGA